MRSSPCWELTWNLSPPLDIISNPNLLTPNQSSMETDATGWTPDGVGNAPGNSYYIYGTAAGSVPLVGVSCLEGHASGVPTINAGYITTPYTTAAVTPTHTYRASVWFRNYWGSMYGIPSIVWYNSGGTQIGSDSGATVGTSGGYPNGVSEWQQLTVEAVAPSGAAYAALDVFLGENGVPYTYSTDYVSDRPHYLDAAELRDTLVIASVNPRPTTIARSVVIPTPNILTTPQNRTVTPSTIARSVVVPTPTVVGGTSFTPTDITGSVIWWDFSVAASNLWQNTIRSTVVTTDGQFIQGVTDKSGAGHHGQSGGTTGSSPLYKTAIINGKSVARFDGTDDFLGNFCSVHSRRDLEHLHRREEAQRRAGVQSVPLVDGDGPRHARDVLGNGLGVPVLREQHIDRGVAGRNADERELRLGRLHRDGERGGEGPDQRRRGNFVQPDDGFSTSTSDLP